jgi:quercetin dioxygenase-like cupin family protein
MTVIDTRHLTPRDPFPGFHARFVHSANMTFAYWEIDAGAELPRHGHVHEQVVNMIAGTFELTVGGDTRVLEPGMVAIIPSQALHSGRAITSCRIIDVFYPVREDYQ